MNKENREWALKKMSECKQTKQKYAAGGSAKVRKNVATKSGKVIKEK
jgi:hypothetical protein